MSTGYTSRKLEIFSAHGRTKHGPIDYIQFFRDLKAIPPENRQYVTATSRLIAIPTLHFISKITAWFIVYEGDPGVSPLIFNRLNAKERIQKLRSGEMVASKTHCIMNLDSREVIIEYNHRGAKASDIALALEEISVTNNISTTLTFELNPVADEEFVKAIDSFARIRVASLRVARPNIDWTDHYNNLTEVAKDSDARAIEVSLTATRNGSLSPKKGIIRFIKDLSSKGLSVIKGARVIGTRQHETAETTISLANHITHQKIRVKMTTDGHVLERDIRDKMLEYLLSRVKTRSAR